MVRQFNVGDRVELISKDGYILDDNQMSGRVVDYNDTFVWVDVDNYGGGHLAFCPRALVEEKPKKIMRIKFMGIPLFTIEGDGE